MHLSNFRSARPTYMVDQADGLKWLARAQGRLRGDSENESSYLRRLTRFGCGPEVIHRRGTYLEDFTHHHAERMTIFGDPEHGALDARQRFYSAAVRAPVEALTTDAEFETWIHVTCTGYASPSVVQEMVSRRGWGDSVETLHAYHMGCYAAIPALRMARGLGRTEIVHTELCTLHLDPANVAPEQLVIQSLFADGVIAYRATDQRPAGPGFEVEATREVIAPESGDAMSWVPSPRNFQMTLSRRVPQLVRDHVARVVEPWRESNAVYAIHPGGPRIIDAVKDALGLSEEQVLFSREILRDHGNMSSATLPHVWARVLDQTPPDTPVISLAFGPGLTIAAAKFRTHA